MIDSAEINLGPLTADIVAAYVAHNALSADKLADLIGSVHAALSKASSQAVEPEKVELVPAVSIKKSVGQDYIICLEDGKKFKSLKRHLRTHYDLSPEEYREKWGLARDYPMVAPAYAEARSNLAKSMGLGQRNGAMANGTAASAVASASAAKGKVAGKRGRKPA
jgi:predicted transcriptional regulator